MNEIESDLVAIKQMSTVNDIKRNKRWRAFWLFFICIISVIIAYVLICVDIKGITLYTFDKIFALSILVCAAICFCFLACSLVIDEGYEYIEGEEVIFYEAHKKKTIWLNSCITWLIIYYWVIGSSYLSTVIAIYITTYEIELEAQIPRIVLYSILSLVLSILNMLIVPFNHAKGYRKAYEIIDEGLIESISQKDVALLKEARIKSEKIIGDFTYKHK